MVDTTAFHITDEELAERISESAAEGKAMRVEAGGRTFVLTVERERETSGPQTTSSYDPEKVGEVLDKYVGAWAHLDVDQMIEDLYRAREEGSRPANRP